MKNIQLISDGLNISQKQVKSTLDLLNNDATIPFISRYRKEATGNLDEVQISDIKDFYNKLIEINKRRESIIKSISEQDKLTLDLKNSIENASSLSELEDIYLPYKKKRKTRADIAIEKGLEPLAKIIMSQNDTDINYKANNFINKDVKNTEEAIQGAKDIIAEWINEKRVARNRLRNLFSTKAIISSKLVKGKDEEGEKYKDYFNFEEPLKKCASHRLLALKRGEKEGFLKIKISPEKEDAIEILNNLFISTNYESSQIVKEAIKDSYKRLLQPSISTEFENITKLKADEEAINVFAKNLRTLLLAPPLGQKTILAIDPGYKSGCKIVCLDKQGNLVHNETIYPHKPQEDRKVAYKKMSYMIDAYKIDAIAIGNGTASRETEFFVSKLKFSRDVQIFVVSENGASVYSASSVAREEFPQYDVTVRGAVSIGRRLMDPLAELVKIDPKSIGVGQYQHDVDAKKLQDSLDRVVESSVNLVGVNINTASKHLLNYVSGLGPQLASNIIDYRTENGDFKSRKDFLKVKRMGEKAFEQSAGFMRIPNAKNPLDNSAVHPESYKIVQQIAKDQKCSIEELINDDSKRKNIDLKKYISNSVGLPTLTDIIEELTKPGRDPRKTIKVFSFAKGIQKIEDLKVGMKLPGIVTNVTNFGAFVDIGIKQNGLIHISNLRNEYTSNPADVISVHQHVKVKIIELDIKRNRIQLSMKEDD